MNFPSFTAATQYLKKQLRTSGQRLIAKATIDLANDIKSRHGRYPSDISWARLKPATIARKGRDTPLHQTGSMQQAVQWVIHGTTSEVFTDHPIAPIQEYGAILKGGVIPPRPIWRPAVMKLEMKLESEYTPLVILD